MRKKLEHTYLDPVTHTPLTLHPEQTDGEDVLTGALHNSGGQRYPIIDGIAHLYRAAESTLPEVKQNREYYANVGAVYDAGMDWLFKSFYEDESAVRGQMVSLLELQPGSRVLEIGAGTCRDSAEILGHLSAGGELFISDLSAEMLQAGRVRIETPVATTAALVEFLVCDAEELPFPAGYFDAVYHFGGLNLFNDPARSFQEINRVVRTGGKVVIGDEGLPLWLRATEFGKILLNANPLYRHEPPLAALPPDVREVCVRWVLGNAFYVIDYRVGEGEPPLNLDLPIPGKRGGTHRTRYYGLLEGVTPALKDQIIQAAAASGLSLHDWLEARLRESLT